MKAKILLIGIDGGTWKVLEPALCRGYMPFLGRLQEHGAWGVLNSTLPAVTAAAWSTFHTGCNPGVHGVVNFGWWDCSHREFRYVSSHHLATTLWSEFSKAGYRVGLFNVPMTYPPRPLNGWTITGLPTPSVQSDFTYPAELREKLLAEFPSYQILNLENINNLFQAGSETDFLRRVFSLMELHIQAAEWLLAESPVDILMFHFQLSDVLQHAMWKWLDPGHDSFDSEKQSFLFQNFYGALDKGVQRLSEQFAKTAGTDFLTVLISDHGFEKHRVRFNLGAWLYQQGYLRLRFNDILLHKIKRVTKSLHLGRRLQRFCPTQQLQSLEKRFLEEAPPMVWEKSRAFCMGRSSEGFIYLLERDFRKRQMLAKEISEKLCQIRYPETGESVIKRVWKKEELYHGNRLDFIPDLLVEPVSGFTCTSAFRPEEPLFLPVEGKADFHQGKHHRDGIYLFSGQNVLLRGQQKTLNIQDLAPTLLWYAGIAPSAMEGEIQDQFFHSSIERIHPERKDALHPNETSAVSLDAYSPEEEEQIRRRLEDLGYL